MDGDNNSYFEIMREYYLYMVDEATRKYLMCLSIFLIFVIINKLRIISML
jgi:hypothetical protein